MANQQNRPQQTRTQTQTRQQPQAPFQEKPAQPLANPQPPHTNGAEEKFTEYTPLGEEKSLKLSVNFVRATLCKPTKQGHWPEDAIVRQYIAVCAHRRLNPFVGDCWLLGYDSQKYGPQFSIVVAVQALFKRAEINKEFDGIESGVIVINGDGKIEERQGDLVVRGEELVGGWALVYRKDRSRPFYQRLALETYRKSTQQWDSDAPGMIVKCAESGALRQAFPSDIGGLYLEQELHEVDKTPALPAAATPASARAELATRLSQPRVVGNAPPPAQEGTQTRQEAQGEHDQTAEESVEETQSEAQEAAPEGQEGQEAAGAVKEEVKFG